MASEAVSAEKESESSVAVVEKDVCRKIQGKAEEGNTCFQVGMCESCPLWWQLGPLQRKIFFGRGVAAENRERGEHG